MRLLFDTAVFVYAVGREHPDHEPCRELVRLLAQEAITAYISAEAVQEYVHVRTRKGVERSQAVDEARSIVALCRVHDVTMTELQVGLQLFRPTRTSTCGMPFMPPLLSPLRRRCW